MKAHDLTIHLNSLYVVHRLPISNVTGVTVFNRGPKTPTTVAAHINDIIEVVGPMVEGGVRVLVIIADGGADYNSNHEINSFYYGRLFRHFPQLDVLFVACYAPGQSAMNMIERAWSPLTRSLISVYFPSTLEGQTVPPRQQTRLTAEEREDMECELFDSNLDKLKRHWDNVEYRGNPVKVISHYSRQAEVPNTTDEYHQLKGIVTTHSTVGLYRHPDVAAEYSFALKHVERRIGMLIFTKCPHTVQCQRCGVSPAPSVDHIQLAKKFPSPTPVNEGHFTTFLQAIEDDRCGNNPDAHMPKYASKGLGRCTICNRYIFTSNADKEKHRKKAHPPQAQVARAQAGH